MLFEMKVDMFLFCVSKSQGLLIELQAMRRFCVIIQIDFFTLHFKENGIRSKTEYTVCNFYFYFYFYFYLFYLFLNKLLLFLFFIVYFYPFSLFYVYCILRLFLFYF